MERGVLTIPKDVPNEHTAFWRTKDCFSCRDENEGSPDPSQLRSQSRLDGPTSLHSPDEQYSKEPSLKKSANCYIGKKCLERFFPIILVPFMQSSYEWILSSENLQEPRRVRSADLVIVHRSNLRECRTRSHWAA